MANTLDIAPIPLSARTGNFVGDSVGVGARRVLRLTAQVVATTASTAVALEHSEDGTAWAQLFSATLAAGSSAVWTVLAAKPLIRAKITCSGNHTVSVSGAADTVYATKEDVGALAIQSAATAQFTDDLWATALLAATAEASSYLSVAYQLPLAAWGFDIRQHTARLAAFSLICGRGFRPGGPDEILVVGRKTAIEWFSAVAKGLATPEAIIDATPSAQESAFALYSDTPRGWAFS